MEIKKNHIFAMLTSLALLSPVTTAFAEQDLKESVCIVQSGLPESDQKSLEETAKTLSSLLYVSCSPTAQEFFFVWLRFRSEKI